MDQEAAAKVRLDNATAILAAQSLGKGRSEPKKTLDLGTDKDVNDKHDEKVGLNQLLANIAEEFDKTLVQTNPAVMDIIRRNLGKLFSLHCMGAGDDAKGVETKVPEDDTEDEGVPSPTSPPMPPAGPTPQPSERQRTAELAENAAAPAATDAAAVATSSAATALLEQQQQQQQLQQLEQQQQQTSQASPPNELEEEAK